MQPKFTGSAAKRLFDKLKRPAVWIDRRALVNLLYFVLAASAQEALEDLLLRLLRTQTERLQLQDLLARDAADGRLMDERRIDMVAGDLGDGAHLGLAHDDRIAGNVAEAGGVALHARIKDLR